MGGHAAAPVSQRHQGVRGRGAQRQLCRRRRRAQRLGGGGEPDGASAGAAARRRIVRAQGQPAGDDGGRPRLSERTDADLRCAGEPDRAGHRALQPARADHRRRADLCDEMADPAAGGFSRRRARHRRAHHHRRRGGAVRRRLELRHQARRRRMARPGRRAFVRRRPVAGLRAAAGGAAETPRRSAGPEPAARRACFARIGRYG